MIRPEAFAIKSKRSTGERNRRPIFDLWRFLTQIQPRDSPAFTVLFGPAQHVDHSINKRVAGNLRTNLHRAQNVALGVQFQDSMLIPLTQVKTFSVVTEI